MTRLRRRSRKGCYGAPMHRYMKPSFLAFCPSISRLPSTIKGVLMVLPIVLFAVVAIVVGIIYINTMIGVMSRSMNIPE